MEANKARQATRKTIIEDVDVHHLRRGEPFFSQKFAPNGVEVPDEVWQIFVTVRTGLQPIKTTTLYAFSKAELESHLANNLVGSEITDWLGSKENKQHIFSQLIKAQSPFGVVAGDAESPLAFDVLGDAGITEGRFGSISREVCEYLGNERLSELKDAFDENWDVAAAFEYCWINLPHSSPAFVAAAYQYHFYITGNDFAAGYFWKDLEVLVHGVEETAQQSLDTRKRAGQLGSKKSVEARAKRRIDLFDKIEAIAFRNPDIVKLGIMTVANFAVSACSEENPSLWGQGKGQVSEYLGEIRRGEAGAEMQARYKSLFDS